MEPFLFIPEEKTNNIKQGLEYKKNIILTGAPGVGKSYIAQKLPQIIYDDSEIGAVEYVQFHQSYSYEEFIEGLRPNKNGKLEVVDGIFKSFCQEAMKYPEQEYFFIIDEINRGNLSKIFGELLFLIESDKRDRDFSVTLPYSKSEFYVPENINIIGLLNGVDKSTSELDLAFRRRFVFFEIEPAFGQKVFNEFIENKYGNYPTSLKLIKKINEALGKINKLISESVVLGSDYRIGHSYFTSDKPLSKTEIECVWNYEILPIINEYNQVDPRLQIRSILKEIEGLFRKS